MGGGHSGNSDYGGLGSLAEGLLAIRKRGQFHLWCQGELQAFLPHRLVLCANGDLHHDTYNIERLQRQSLAGAPSRESLDILLGSVLSAWRHGGYVPLVLGSSQDEGEGRQRAILAVELSRNGQRDCSAHGLISHEHGVGAFFAFLGGLAEPPEQRARRLELLVPHLYAALQRVVYTENLDSLDQVDAQSLSTREAQILRWIRAGKTNQQIGHILNISPYTVKNHVQKILRKMNVSNRAQAAGVAADLSYANQPAANQSGDSTDHPPPAEPSPPHVRVAGRN